MEESIIDEERRRFADRLEEAYMETPDAPGRVYGRNVWLSEEMAKRGRHVTTETVRRWFAGIAMPRHRTLDALADVLDVDPRYLTGLVDEKSHRKGKPLHRRPSEGEEVPASAARILAPTFHFTAAKFLETWAHLSGVPARAEGRQIVFEQDSWSRRVQVVAIEGREATLEFPSMGGTLTESLPHAVVVLGPGGAMPRVFVMPAHLVELSGGPGASREVEAAPDGLVIEQTGVVLKPLKALPDIYDML